MASRRVSFAAEATLHTFHEIDYFQEQTSSTEASRRASAATARDFTAQSQASTGYGPGTPRPQQYQNEDDTTSILYSSDSEPPDAVEEDIDGEDEEEDEDASSSDMEDGTMMTIEDVTGTTIGSVQSGASDSDESTLDEALRLAAQHAGTQRIESDGLDDGEEVIPSFGWVKKASQGSQPVPSTAGDEGTEMDMDMDMDMTTSMGRIIDDDASEAGNEDMSMEVTKVLGGILPQRRVTSGADAESESGDATMELTRAIGSIHRADDEEDDIADHEDMSMEMTTVLGGVLGNQKRKSIQQRRQSMSQMSDADNTMDMTASFGQILSNTYGAPRQDKQQDDGQEDDEDADDATMGMDMTVAMGGIIGSSKSPRSVRKSIMQEEVNKPNSPRAAVTAAISKAMPSKQTIQPATAPASPVLSSPVSVRAKPSRHSVAAPQRVTRSSSRTPSPEKSTPKQAARLSIGKRKSASPGQTASATGTTAPPKPQQGSPGKKSQHSTPASAGSQSRPKSTSSHTPQRRLSGLGADNHGRGSPRVAEILDRRSSIGESASKFVPGKRRVSFGDPKAMAKEVERDDAEARSSPQMLRPQEDRDATFNLREMIDSLSPARKPLNGRKSLHVGSARGVLGKRPMELDDDEAEENDGIKRLKGHQSSPVKNIRLPMPKADITGKLTRLNLEPNSPVMTPSRTPPRRNERATSPRKQHWPVDNKANHTVHNVNLFESPSKDPDSSFSRLNRDQIHLQDFLDMTSIRFMELNTTKRRHTVAPSNLNKGLTDEDYDEMSLERCVVASACTVPRLELYQHSCRELKKYIAEGRRMVKEIEEDTFEDNPPLFKEYMTAPADVKAMMDNEFKNVKTHARLLSKAMWYEWRMKLQEGLREGLVKISVDMLHDDRKLDEQQAILSAALPTLISEYDALEEERVNLDEAAQELADCDPEELQEVRDELVNVEQDIEEKQRQIQALREEYQEAENEAEELAASKTDCLADIARSEKIREDCRGWNSSEVNSLKDRVTALETSHGWAVTGVSGSTISMAYKREIELVLDFASFKPGAHNSQIDLWYIADSREKNPIPKSVERDFFLQSIRDLVRSLPADQAHARIILKIVQGAWDEAMAVAAQISKMSTTFQTAVTKTSDSSIDIKSTLLLVPLQSRVDIILSLESQEGKAGVEVTIESRGTVVYGEHFNTRKIGEFLQARLGSSVAGAKEDWCSILVELHEKLIARGRK